MSDEDTRKRWRGLFMLVRDAVDHGSRAVQKVHLETARRPFMILEHTPGIEQPSKMVHAIHDLTVSSVYESIRMVNAVVGNTLEIALDHAPPKKDP